jgi:hypothetical protein
VRNPGPVTLGRREGQIVDDYLQLYVFGSRMLGLGLVLVGAWMWLHPSTVLS